MSRRSYAPRKASTSSAPALQVVADEERHLAIATEFGDGRREFEGRHVREGRVEEQRVEIGDKKRFQRAV